MSIYVSQLYSGDWYVSATTRASDRERRAMEAFGSLVFPSKQLADDAAAIVRQMAASRRWSITAIDGITRERFECFVWTREPADGIARAIREAQLFGRQCHGFRADPVDDLCDVTTSLIDH